jgi:hypothetical protein
MAEVFPHMQGERFLVSPMTAPPTLWLYLALSLHYLWSFVSRTLLEGSKEQEDWDSSACLVTSANTLNEQTQGAEAEEGIGGNF